MKGYEDTGHRSIHSGSYICLRIQMGYGLCSINAAVNFQDPVYKIQPIIQLKFINKLILWRETISIILTPA